MKCEECEKAGATYTLRWGGVYPRTLMAFYPFMDDDGRRHYHDDNSGGGEYWKCSHGHYVTPPEKPSCWCGWPVTGTWADETREKNRLANERYLASYIRSHGCTPE